jgi:hypothetical protein
MILKIVSGGQTGADQGALAAARALGLATGGYAPLGFVTEDGPQPELKAFGLAEHSSRRYAPRTQCNVLLADATLLFGNLYSPGTAYTKHCAECYRKPIFAKEWNSLLAGLPQVADPIFAAWLDLHAVRTLNVAGNRESQNPGIFYAVKYYLIVSLERAKPGASV